MALPQLSPGVYWHKDRAVTTADGATIRYTILGDSPVPGGGTRPTVALLSGFICPDTWWHFLAPALVESGYRVVLLHYRGIATSGMPSRPDEGSMSIERFAGDALDVLHAAGIGEVGLVGHSMGGQVMLEVAKVIPGRVWAMVGVTAADRAPTEDLYGAGHIADPLVGLAIRAISLLREPVGTAVYRGFWRTVPFLPLMRLTRAFGHHAPADILASYADHAATLSAGYFTELARALHGHRPDDAALARLGVPTRFVTGDADPFTPIRTAKRAAGLLGDAELHVVPGTTHAAILEAPTEVNRLVIDHLDANAPTASPLLAGAQITSKRSGDGVAAGGEAAGAAASRVAVS